MLTINSLMKKISHCWAWPRFLKYNCSSVGCCGFSWLLSNGTTYANWKYSIVCVGYSPFCVVSRVSKAYILYILSMLYLSTTHFLQPPYYLKPKCHLCPKFWANEIHPHKNITYTSCCTMLWRAPYISRKTERFLYIVSVSGNQ